MNCKDGLFGAEDNINKLVAETITQINGEHDIFCVDLAVCFCVRVCVLHPEFLTPSS